MDWPHVSKTTKRDMQKNARAEEKARSPQNDLAKNNHEGAGGEMK